MDNKNIKEILDEIKILNGNVELGYEKSQILLDYITNLQTIEQQYSAILSENAELQAEIKSANESITWWTNRFNAIEKRCEYLQRSCDRKEEQRDDARMEYMEQEDYKSRNKKAIEYNYELQERYCHSALFDDLVASKIYEISEKNIKLLNGGDKE